MIVNREVRPADKRGRQLEQTVFLLALSLLAFVWLVPLIWLVVMSFKPNAALMRSTAGLIPSPFTLENYDKIFSVSDTPRWLANSAIVSSVTALLTLLLSSLAGYAFARIPFKGKPILFIFVLAGLMVPEQAVFIPLHTMFAGWRLHNTYTALIAPRLAMPLGVFIMTQFIKQIPPEIEEAAQLDNANRLTVFFRIILPLSVPALTTLGLFTFVLTWNDFLWPLVSATSSEMYTITVGLATLQGNFAQTEGLGFLMGSAAVASAPMVLLFLLFQRHIVEGVRLGGRF